MQPIIAYGGFKIVKEELYKIFILININPTGKKKDLIEASGYGDNKIENLKYYLKHFNLLDSNYHPTELGKIIYESDKYFEDEITLWVLFYHWSERVSNPFLHYLLNESSDSKTKEELRADFSSWAIINEVKIDYKKDFLGDLISISLRSFSDIEAFRVLNLYRVKDDKYHRDRPYKVTPLIVAFVLFKNRQGRATISFLELLKEPNNIGKVFNLDRDSLLMQIYALRDLGFVSYRQTANLHDIVYTFQGSHLILLKKYYEQY
jgi:hypothetical protein